MVELTECTEASKDEDDEAHKETVCDVNIS